MPLALQRLQEHSDAARKVVGAWLADLGAGKNPVAFDKLTDSIANSVNELSPNVEATSAYYYEHDTVTLTFVSMEFWRNAETEEVDFYIVQIGKRIIVVKVDLRLTAALEADFTFGRYEFIDRDYVRLGDNHLEGQVEFNASALVTIVGDLSKRPPQLAIEAVELVDVDNTIDFGEIEPDYGGDQEAD